MLQKSGWPVGQLLARRGPSASCRSFCSVQASLKEPTLFKQQAFVGGNWISASSSGGTIKVTDPATNHVIGSVPDLGVDHVHQAVRAAQDSFESWKRTPAKARSQILQKWSSLLLKHQQDLAMILTREQGKPLAEAAGEIAYAASYLDLFAAQALSLEGDLIQPASKSMRVLVQKEPVGVVAAISPWNFPTAMIARKAGAAIAAGCPLVVKPSELTPFSALSFFELGQQAGVPDGVLSCLTTSQTAQVGAALMEHPEVRKISFTGSTRVGKLLMQQSADTVKRSSLELGGNAPFIIFEDADLDLAVEAVTFSKFRNAGQTCVCANRIFVQASVYDKVVKAMVERAQKLIVGPGTRSGVTVGPLINEAAMEKVERHIADAVSKGAKVALGGRRAQLGPGHSDLFFEPTILTDVTPDMLCFQEEVFGPSAPIFKFETEEEVVKLANSTKMGLAAYFYTSNMSRVFRMADSLQYGMVGANSGSVSLAEAPFGGVKESGMGREGSKYGLDDYLQIKAIHIGGL